MKISNLLTMGLLSTCLFTACSDNDDDKVEQTDKVVFNSVISGLQSRVNGSAWDLNDEIGIFMQVEGSEVANKKYLAQADGKLNAAAGNELYYPMEGTASFLAYYPYASLQDKNVSVSVADQSKPSKIDFLYSDNAKNIKNGQAVTLEFGHQLSKIQVNIKADETVKETKGVTIALTGMNTSATFNLADASLKSADSKADIQMNVNAEGSQADAIVLPTASVENMKMVFTLDGKTFEWPITIPENKGLEKGTKYTFNATLSIFHNQPTVKMGDAVITDWVEKVGGDIDVDFGGGEEPTEKEVLLKETFDKDQGNFTITNIQLPEGSNYVWKWSSYDNKGTIPAINFMKAGAYINKENKAAEAWLISPAVQLPADKAATLEFNHTHNYSKADHKTELTLMVAESGTQVTAAATGWSKVEIPTYGSGKDYNYVLASVDLSAYKGKNIQFAFRYISSTVSAPTWQINDVKVTTGNGGETPEPDPDPEPEPDPDPIEGTVLFDETFGDPGSSKPSIDAYEGWTDTHKMTYSDPLMTDSKSNANVRKTSSMDGHVWFAANKDAALRIAGFDAKAYKTVQLSYEIAANQKGNQNAITISTDKGDITVPSSEITEQNKFQTVTVTLSNDFTYIQFTSKASANKVGYRIDNVKVIASEK